MKPVTAFCRCGARQTCTSQHVPAASFGADPTDLSLALKSSRTHRPSCYRQAGMDILEFSLIDFISLVSLMRSTDILSSLPLLCIDLNQC